MLARNGDAPPSDELRPRKVHLAITLRRDLGLFHTTMIGIGTMIGASIFSLAAITTGLAGPATLVSIALAGAICFLTATTYAQLGGLLQEAGGGYLWVKMAFSRRAGFTAGWISWFGHSIACAFYIIIFAGGIQFLLDEVGLGSAFPFPRQLLAAFVAVVFIWINIRGTALTARTEAVVTIIQLLVFSTFVMAAFYVGFTAPPTSPAFEPFVPSGWGAALVAAGVLAIAFEGYEVVAQSAEETKNPEKTIPRATYLSITVVTGLYLALLGSAMFAEGWRTLAGEGEASLINAGRRFIPVGGALVLIGALLAGALSALNATIFSASRVAFAMGRDGTLPKAFGQIHRRKRTPDVAIRVSGLVILITALLVPLTDIAAAAGIMFLLLFIMVNASFIKLRKTNDRVRERFPSARSNIVPAAAITGKVIILGALATFSPLALGIAIAWTLSGVAVYWLANLGREEEGAAPSGAGYAHEGPTIAPEKFHALVPAASPREGRIVGLAAMVARASKGHVSLMRVVEIPRSTPIAAAADLDYSFDAKVVEGLLGFAVGADATAQIVASHELEDAIIEKARDDNVNLMFLGWRGTTATRKAIFGGTVDELLLRAPCDVAVVRTRMEWEPKQFRKIALLAGPHRHVRPAADLAAALAIDHPAHVTVLRVVRSERERRQPDDDVEAIVEHLHKLGLDTTVRTVVNPRTAEAVILESDRYDLLILGSPPGLLRKVIARRAEESIAKSAKCPIILYRHRGPTPGDFLQPFMRAVQGEEPAPSSVELGEVAMPTPSDKPAAA